MVVDDSQGVITAIAQATAGYSGADLTQIVRKSSVLAVQQPTLEQLVAIQFVVYLIRRVFNSSHASLC